MVCPSSALISWPSMRIENFFLATGRSFSAHVGRFHVAAKAPAGLVMGLFAREPGDHFVERVQAGADGERRAGVPPAGTRFFGRGLLIIEVREEPVPAIGLHQLTVDV